ncbi:hypothetical protein EYF80_033904 [Liparis tanakae]|uniref:Uncharacterized protein n=1 Tax=Liparis tanakae TaxID=230148 RepID=A0A4Z2GS07_9TELE|nr:hypothetical protein EYF80_033904 [Liparis tanakae]
MKRREEECRGLIKNRKRKKKNGQVYGGNKNSSIKCKDIKHTLLLETSRSPFLQSPLPHSKEAPTSSEGMRCFPLQDKRPPDKYSQKKRSGLRASSRAPRARAII